MVPVSTTPETAKTVKIEDMLVGYRYANVIAPRYERNYTVATVEHYTAPVQAWRGGQWVDIPMVKVTYEGGMSISFELGTEVYVECEVAK